MGLKTRKSSSISDQLEALRREHVGFAEALPPCSDWDAFLPH